MKKTGHPEYVRAKVVCSCGETFETRATKPEIRVEICSKCHPFYLGTGRQRLVDTGGRVERFQKKYGEYRPRDAGKSENADEARAEAAAEVEAEVALGDASAATADEAKAEEATEVAGEPVAEETV